MYLNQDPNDKVEPTCKHPGKDSGRGERKRNSPEVVRSPVEAQKEANVAKVEGTRGSGRKRIK